MSTKVKSRLQTPGLTDADLLEMYRQMVVSRFLSERWIMLNRQGKAAIGIASEGHEAASIGAVWAMDPVQDIFYLYYRDLPGQLALGVTVHEALLGFMAKQGEPFSGGRQFPFHGAYPSKRIYNTSNVVGANVTHAVGAALAASIRNEPTVVLCSFGDGGTSEGEWHESLNFAGIHRLPVIFLCENNKFAISVPQRKQMAVESVAIRAEGYGFPGVSVDGSDVLAMYRATREAHERATSGGGPTLLEARVERLKPHTTDDDDRRYRTPEEIEAAFKRDPLPLFRDELMERGLLTAEMVEQYDDDAKREVNEATDAAEATPFPDPSTLLDHLFATGEGS